MLANKFRLFGPLALLVVLLASVFSPRPATPGPWLGTLFEWLHVPVFGLISLAILALLPSTWPALQRFAMAFAAAILLGVLTEAAQIPMRRDASWEDIIADATGSAIFLLAAYPSGRKRFVATLRLVCALGMLIGSAWPLMSVTQAVIHRESQFPVIFGGDIQSQVPFVSARNNRMETRMDTSTAEIYTRVEVAGRSNLGIELRGLVADWNAYTLLRLEMGVEDNKALNITVRVHDKYHRRGTQPHNDRFNGRFAIGPGRTTIEIPLGNIKGAPLGRDLDLSDIDALVIYSSEVDEAVIVRLYEIRLD